MEPAHAGLSNLPLPGGNNPYDDGSGAMVSYSEDYPQGGDEEYLPRRRGRGFFERLFGGSDDESGDLRQGDSEQMDSEVEQSDSGRSAAEKLRQRGNNK
jgi:hypothetical protein